MNQFAGCHWIKWPKLRSGEPVFRTAQEAVHYAHQVYHRDEVLTGLRNYRVAVYVKIKAELEARQPNYSHLIGLAQRAHLLRECIEECERMKSHFFLTPRGA